MTGIILAAGDGVRFENTSGGSGCKALSQVNDSYLIEYALNNLSAMNVSEAVIVVGKFSDRIREALGSSFKGISITYAEQTICNGIINALMCGISCIKNDDAVVLQLADEIFADFNKEVIIKALNDRQYDFYCGITHEDDETKIRANYSVKTDSDMKLISCFEKPEYTENNLKGTGFCVFSSECISMLKDAYKENSAALGELCDYMSYLISAGRKGKCINVAEKEFNINTLQDLEEAINYFSESRGKI